MSFRKRLKSIIKEDYGTQVRFAIAIGATKASISDYISGKRKPNYLVLYRIAKEGYNLNWLLTGYGKKSNEETIKMLTIYSPEGTIVSEMAKDEILRLANKNYSGFSSKVKKNIEEVLEALPKKLLGFEIHLPSFNIRGDLKSFNCFIDSEPYSMTINLHNKGFRIGSRDCNYPNPRDPLRTSGISESYEYSEIEKLKDSWLLKAFRENKSE